MPFNLHAEHLFHAGRASLPITPAMNQFSAVRWRGEHANGFRFRRARFLFAGFAILPFRNVFRNGPASAPMLARADFTRPPSLWIAGNEPPTNANLRHGEQPPSRAVEAALLPAIPPRTPRCTSHARSDPV